ncbi:hypothetical protein CfE428DRAFT_2570 [Chthoniobacter flavus Ellin428]|uniref:Uncharacterized protein n=1 Tax=Chthoniobacter flavus Ellin428 TaxID=497964 RepID=B4D0W9_9BACT|nr:hypothetical protein CfE428DRAFT_2570 [Chthoniobacter flavus Ellin428]
MQQFLKPASRTARAGVVTTEFLPQFLVAMDDAEAAFDLRFGWEPFTALAGALEKRGRLDLNE